MRGGSVGPLAGWWRTRGNAAPLAPCRPVAWLTRAVGIARRSARLVVRAGRLGLGAGRAGGLIRAPSIPRGAPAALDSAGPDTELTERRAVEAAGFTNARASLEVAHRGLRVWPHPTVDGARIESLGLESLLSGPNVACRDHATPARRLGFLVFAGRLHVLIATRGVRVTMRGLDYAGARAAGDRRSHGWAEAVWLLALLLDRILRRSGLTLGQGRPQDQARRAGKTHDA